MLVSIVKSVGWMWLHGADRRGVTKNSRDRNSVDSVAGFS